MKIIYHFGAHKTASTHLQFNLNLNRNLLERHGVKYFCFHNVGSLQADTIKIRNTIDDPEKVKNYIDKTRKQIEEEIQGFDTAIISYEGSLGNLSQHHYQYIYEDAEKLIKIFQKILHQHQVIPLYALRNYDSFLRSTYQYSLKIKPSFHLSLKQYLSKINTEPHRWKEIIQALEDAFDYIPKIYTQEEYKKNWKAITHAIIDLTKCNIPLDQLDFEAKKRNISRDRTITNYYYTRNKLLSGIPNFIGKAKIQALLKKRPSFFETRIGAQLLLDYGQKKVPCTNDIEDYRSEVGLLKNKYGLNYKTISIEK